MADAFLHHLPRILRSHRVLSGLAAGAPAWALAALAREAAAERTPPLLVVGPTHEVAEELAAELRFYLQGALPVLLFPADDVRPYEGLSPHPALPRQRLVALDLLDSGAPGVVVASARALQQRVLAPEVLAAHRGDIRLRQALDRDLLVRQLVEQGYLVAGVCDEPGTVAFRGEVLDLWPTGHDLPVRIELDDDQVEDMRPLDPATQRSAGRSFSRLRLLPAREGILTPEAISRVASRLSAEVDATAAGHNTRRRVLQDLREGLWFPGAEDYLAALHPTVDLLSVVRGPVIVVGREAVFEALDRFERLAQTCWAAESPDERAPVPPEQRYVSAAAVQAALASAGYLEAFAPDAPDFGARDNTILRVSSGELAPVVARLREWLDEGWQVVLAADSQARAERLVALLAPHKLRPTPLPPAELPPAGVLGLWIGELARGFHAPYARLAVVSADELFTAKTHTTPRVTKSLREATVTSFSQLKAGHFVVHARHGIGRFEGLKRLPVPVADEPIYGIERPARPALEQDFVVVCYRDGDRMYLPVMRLEELARYQAVGSGEPVLDKLGGESWAKRKAKVRDKALALASDLLRLHAMRAVAKGHAFEGLPPLYREFEESFPYVETPDQDAAIRDVLDDLAKPEPMDRLIIGDVGFGKTEVAMRAAMRVILDGYQVAVLCPTTVLAFQHLETFTNRFEKIPVRIELLSRFRSAADAAGVLADTAAGKVDILIGTHAILGRELRFKKLGLIVVDEEHRFGVKQKERLKKLSTEVDSLAMSATPIPRTLHMALSGLRKVSTIATPPADRQAIKTRVARHNEQHIREEVLHELKRGGQVFYVHNRISSIGAVATRLGKLVPEARIGVAHGQMEAAALESVLLDFMRHRSHVLVCTAIVESGVDLPNVNTMIIDRADRFGLAQLYQLRGRVGRGSVRGHCLLLVPDDERLPPDAMRRLQVLQENTELGAGFAIANADLELRGAGDLLGDAQHGAIEAVGLDTYLDLLEQAAAEVRGDLARARIDPELEIPVPSLIPETYIPDVEERLGEYRRLAVSGSVHAVRELIDGWEDRYGNPPPEVLNLGWLAEARVRCRELGIVRVSWLKVRVVLDFHESTRVSAAQVAKLVSGEPGRFGFVKGGNGLRLEVRFVPKEAEWPFRFLHWVFLRLGEN